MGDEGNVNWLEGWKYRKRHVVNGAAGAGTNYQVKLTVHYGFGVDSGENVYLNQKCKTDFGDVRVTLSDGQTVVAGEENGWRESKANADRALIWFKIPESLDTEVTVYVYYGNEDAEWSDSGLGTFLFFDDFASRSLWALVKNFDAFEGAVIHDGKVYASSMGGGLWILNFSDGAVIHNYVGTDGLVASPVVHDGFIYVKDLGTGYVRRMAESDGSITHNYDSGSTDFEMFGWDEDNDNILVPTTDAVKCLSTADLSEVWSFPSSWYSMACSSVLVVGDYAYFKPNLEGTLYKVNKLDGSLVDAVDGLGNCVWVYSSPIYDPDHDYIYVFGNQDTVHCVDAASMTLVWSRTFTGFSSAQIMRTPMYHGGKVFVSVRDTGANYKAKLYALDYSDGSILWTFTGAWDAGEDLTTGALTDDYVIISGIDYSDYSKGNLYVVRQSDGSLLTEGRTHYGAMCAGVTAVSDGKAVLGLKGGTIECVSLGSGDDGDSLYWGHNVYRNGYVGSRLAVDPQLNLTNSIGFYEDKLGSPRLTVLNGVGTILTFWGSSSIKAIKDLSAKDVALDLKVTAISGGEGYVYEAAVAVIRLSPDGRYQLEVDFDRSPDWSAISQYYPPVSYLASSIACDLVGKVCSLAAYNTTVKFLVDYAEKGSVVAAESGNVEGQIGFGLCDANRTVSMGWVRVRKYVNPEPSHGAWGEQESNPTPAAAQTLFGKILRRAGEVVEILRPFAASTDDYGNQTFGFGSYAHAYSVFRIAAEKSLTLTFFIPYPP